jgi:hypothetical protein
MTTLESILNTLGSSASTKNEYGVTIMNTSNNASSMVFKPLNTTKSDTIELLKVIDTNINELLPNNNQQLGQFVKKQFYKEQLSTNADIEVQISLIKGNIDSSNYKILNLTDRLKKEKNNTLKSEQINDILSNQIDALTVILDGFGTQLSILIQKQIDESVLKSSLEAQNQGFKAQIEALLKQIESLNTTIVGLMQQLGAQMNQTINYRPISAPKGYYGYYIAPTIDGPVTREYGGDYNRSDYDR